MWGGLVQGWTCVGWIGTGLDLCGDGLVQGWTCVGWIGSGLDLCGDGLVQGWTCVGWMGSGLDIDTCLDTYSVRQSLTGTVYNFLHPLGYNVSVRQRSVLPVVYCKYMRGFNKHQSFINIITISITVHKYVCG